MLTSSSCSEGEGGQRPDQMLQASGPDRHQCCPNPETTLSAIRAGRGCRPAPNLQNHGRRGQGAGQVDRASALTSGQGVKRAFEGGPDVLRDLGASSPICRATRRCCPLWPRAHLPAFGHLLVDTGAGFVTADNMRPWPAGRGRHPLILPEGARCLAPGPLSFLRRNGACQWPRRSRHRAEDHRWKRFGNVEALSGVSMNVRQRARFWGFWADNRRGQVDRWSRRWPGSQRPRRAARSNRQGPAPHALDSRWPRARRGHRDGLSGNRRAGAAAFHNVTNIFNGPRDQTNAFGLTKVQEPKIDEGQTA